MTERPPAAIVRAACMPLEGVSVRELLAAGVHFGHKASRWNPRMAPYIFGKRNMVHLIDVRATIRGIVQAYHFLKNLSKQGHLIMFVGTKKQVKSVVEAEGRRCGMPFVSERWPGGLLTNYWTVHSRLDRLMEVERWDTEGVMERFTKAEVSRIQRLKRKLLRNLDGIRNMDRLPAAVIVVDPKHESIAVKEANRIGASLVGLIDTDGDPSLLDIPVPCNDDSMKVVQIILRKFADAIIEGKAAQTAPAPPAPNPETAPEAAATPAREATP